jgi:RsiW-degrading membrane proteinase PrsW (M82 family)
MALMGFETDPIFREGPRTLHGWIHDLAFALFVLALLPSFFFLWRKFRKDAPSAPWRNHARYTLATGVIAALLISLPSVAYYLFVVVVLAWMEVTAIRLWRHSRG